MKYASIFISDEFGLFLHRDNLGTNLIQSELTSKALLYDLGMRICESKVEAEVKVET
jgi:hypothetical protein